MEHGTASRYNNGGCRCDDCRAAAVAYARMWRAKNPEKFREIQRRRGPEYASRWREKHPTYHRDWARRWRAENPERAGERGRLQRLRNLDFVNGVRESCCCTECGSSDKLHFHHREPAEKKFMLSRPGGRSLASVQSELEKCNVLCISCHSKLHNRKESRFDC